MKFFLVAPGVEQCGWDELQLGQSCVPSWLFWVLFSVTPDQILETSCSRDRVCLKLTVQDISDYPWEKLWKKNKKKKKEPFSGRWRKTEQEMDESWGKDSVLITAKLGHIMLYLNISWPTLYKLLAGSCPSFHNLEFMDAWEGRIQHLLRDSPMRFIVPFPRLYLAPRHADIVYMERCVDPSLLWPADKPFSCRMEISHFPSLPSLRPTLGDSQTAGCVLKSIYNSNGQVIVCGELSFLLWRTMGAFLLWPVGSAAECRKHCLPKTPIFWGLMFSVMEMAIS